MTRRYDHLLLPGRIGAMALRNRIVHAPMSLGLGAGDGTCGERFIAYYAERAKGGAALINIGTVSVGYPEGSVDAKQIAASDDKYLPSLSALASAIHAHGAKIVLQLNHNGTQAGGDRAAGRPMATPSEPTPKRGDLADCFLPEELAALAAGNPVMGEIRYQVLDAGGIRRIVAMFAAAAVRAKLAGIDAIEIHGGHGYLLASFLSPVTNRRTDTYGGPVENRARFLVEVIQAVRAAVGPGFPVWCKLDSTEFELDGGITLEDAKATARLAQAAGADAIAVSAYSDVSKSVTHSGSHTPQQPELLVPNAKAIKAVLDIPVITAGRIEVADADRHIADGAFDFVAMGRKLLADPDLPNKLHAGREADIRPCIYCYSCISQAYFRRPVICTVNPAMGMEHEPKASRASAAKRIAVIGGGPVGMEAALRLKARGHSPILFESSDRLGGALVPAGTAYEPNGRYLRWLLWEIANSGITVRLGTPATPDLIASFDPIAVIVATGATHEVPRIAGVDRPHVVTAQAVLAGVPTVGSAQNIVVLGGGMIGLETAEWLASHGKNVVVLDGDVKLGAGLPIVRRARLLFELRQAAVALSAEARDIAIEDRQVTWRDATGHARHCDAEMVVVANGMAGNRTLADRFSVAGYTTHAIGDCTGAFFLETAIRAVADLVDRI